LRGGGGCAKNESGVSPCFGGYPFGGCGYRPFSSHPAGVGERCDLYILAGGVPLLWRRVLLRGRLSPAEGVGNGLTHCAGGYPFGGGIHGRPLCAGVSPTVLGIKKGSTVCTPFFLLPKLLYGDAYCLLFELLLLCDLSENQSCVGGVNLAVAVYIGRHHGL